MPRVEVTRRTEEDAWDAGVVPDDSELSYAPVASPPRTPVGTSDEPAGRPRRPAFDGDAFDDLPWSDSGPSAPAPTRDQTSFDIDTDDVWATGLIPAVPPAESEPSAPAPAAPAASEPKRPRLPFGRKEQAPAPARKEDVRDWLGVDEGFDAKKEGRKIGSWDNFDDHGDDDDSGWKGGAAGAEGIDDPDFAAEEAARIRRKVTSAPDRSLIEKEVWFVATGAGSIGGQGMGALLDEYGKDMRNALFINVQCVGAGAVSFVTSEGMGRRIGADRRLSGTARRVAADNDLPIRGKQYQGPITDATVALARRHKAMSVMAFDINGRQPNARQVTDTADNVDPATVESAVDFLVKLIGEL
jgi:hypothetical protein